MALEKTRTMFDDCANEPTPTSIEECTNQDKVTVNLWKWAGKLEILGKILMIIIIIGGILISFSNAMVNTEVVTDYYRKTTETETSFEFTLFLTNLMTYAVYAIMEYCIYHVIALLIGSLARIVQSTRTTARLAEFEARNRN